MMSLLRANYVFFPISPRNSPVAVAHLLHKVGVQHVLVGRDASMQDLANAALEILKSQYPSDTSPEQSPIPAFEDYFQSQWEKNSDAELDLPLPPTDPDSPALYLHSSGNFEFFIYLPTSLMDFVLRYNGTPKANCLDTPSTASIEFDTMVWRKRFMWPSILFSCCALVPRHGRLTALMDRTHPSSSIQAFF